MGITEIIIYGFALLGILGAVFAFIKTPKDQRFGLPRHYKEEGSDYAPEYTKQERIKLALKIAAWAIPIVVILKYWLFPLLEDYADLAHCCDYGFVTGTQALFYGLFIGMPLSFAVVLFAIEGTKNIKIFRLEQFPLPGEKVLSPTKYVYGVKAKVRSVLFFGVLIFLIGLSIRGYYWANEIIEIPVKDMSACENS